jgi:hypothetical protein
MTKRNPHAAHRQVGSGDAQLGEARCPPARAAPQPPTWYISIFSRGGTWPVASVSAARSSE